MSTLNNSRILFDEERHEYKLGTKEMQGITSIISAVLFPDKYNGVSEALLAKKAEEGHKIHEELQFLALMPTVEATTDNGIAFRQQLANTKFIASEYLVTDFDRVASAIDLVDEDFNLYDIKTTYSLDKEYTRWQLSIYAYLFELVNEDKKAGHLFAVHCKDGACKVVELDRIDAKNVKNLIECYFNGEEFENPLRGKEDNYLIQDILQLEFMIKAKEAELKPLKDELDELKAKQIEEMEKNGVTKWETSDATITYMAPSVREGVDAKKLSALAPEIYEQCKKVTAVKSSLRITFHK